MTDVTRILNAMERGHAKATDKLLPLVYEELRLLAAQKLIRTNLRARPSKRPHWCTRPILRLVGEQNQNWTGHAHFFEPRRKRWPDPHRQDGMS